MTFSEIVSEVADRLNLTSTDAQTRIGKHVNRRYKSVTTAIGLQVARRTVVAATATLGVRYLTFTGIEKIIGISDRSSGRDRMLECITVEEMRERRVGTGLPKSYAVNRMNAGSVEVFLDVEPQEEFTLYADGHETVDTLSGSNEPAFPESFHDVLVEGAIADELMKQEKPQLAMAQEAKFKDRLSELRFWIAKEAYQDIQQGKRKLSVSGFASGGSVSTPNGAASYTQTGLITFDRGPSAPFAVVSGSALVTNLDADKLDGEDGSAYHNASNLNAGTVPDARLAVTVARLGSANTGGDLLFTDATYDIGKSGATRPRDGFFSRNFVIGGTAAIVGVLTATAQAIFNGGMSLAGNLIATNDNTNDIGASGATRFRDLFLGRNATIGGTLGVTGIASFTSDVKTDAFTDYTATSTITGWSSFTGGRKFVQYKKVGKLVFVQFYLEGTSNATTVSFTLPYAVVNSGFQWYGTLGQTTDNGANAAACGIWAMAPNTSTVSCFKDNNNTVWTNSGSKVVAGQFFYEATT